MHDPERYPAPVYEVIRLAYDFSRGRLGGIRPGAHEGRPGAGPHHEDGAGILAVPDGDDTGDVGGDVDAVADRARRRGHQRPPLPGQGQEVLQWLDRGGCAARGGACRVLVRLAVWSGPGMAVGANSQILVANRSSSATAWK